MPKAQPFGPDALNERERIIVEMLAAGNTIRATAIKAGVTEKTVYNARQRRHIQDAIYARQAEMFDGTGGQGLSLLPEVVDTLRRIVTDPQARPSDRIQASKALMSAANEYQNRRLLERQIRDLETRLYGNSHIPPEPGDSYVSQAEPSPDEVEIDVHPTSSTVVNDDPAALVNLLPAD